MAQLSQSTISRVGIRMYLLMVGVTIAMFLAFPVTGYAQVDCSLPASARDILCSPANLIVDPSSASGSAYVNRIRSEGIEAIFLSITSLFAGGAATFAAVGLIYGAFLYATSHGNEEQTTKAKQFITLTLIGFVILSLTYVIVIAIRDIFYEQPTI